MAWTRSRSTWGNVPGSVSSHTVAGALSTQLTVSRAVSSSHVAVSTMCH